MNHESHDYLSDHDNELDTYQENEADAHERWCHAKNEAYYESVSEN